jgi:hypothetical protein
MSEGYKIPIDLSALDEMIQKIDRAAEAIKGLDSGIKSINTSMKSGGRSSRSSGSTDVPGMVDTSGRTFTYDAPGGLSGEFRQQNTQRFLAAQQYQQQRQQFLAGKSSYKTPIGPEPAPSQAGSFSYNIPGGLSGEFRSSNTQRFLAAQKYQEQRQQFLAGKSPYKAPIGPEPFQMDGGFIGPMPGLPDYASPSRGYRTPIGPQPFKPEKGFIGPAAPDGSRRVGGATVTPDVQAQNARTQRFNAPAPAPTPRVAAQASAPTSAPKPTPSPSISPSGSQTIAMPKPLGGPFQNLHAAQSNLQNLINQGVPPSSPAFKDAQVRIHKAQQAVQSIIDAMNPSPNNQTAYRGMSRVFSRGAISLAQAAISSSGMGGAAGLAANAGLFGAAAFGAIPTMLGAAAVGAAAFGYYGGTQGAQRRNLGYNIGGSLGQVAGIQAMGAGGDVGQFGETLRSGGIAGAYFRRKGLRDLGEIQTNKGANYIRALEILREEKDPGMREIVMREAGFAGQSAYIDADKKTFDRFKESMERAPVNPVSIANAEVEIDIAKKTVADYAIVVGGGMAKGINRFNQTMTDKNASFAEKAFAALRSATTFGRLIDFFIDIKPTKSEKAEAERRWKTQSDKEKTNYDPLNERIPKNEIVGGGSRAQSSINIGQSVAAANSYGLQEQIRLGAFPVY